MEGMVNPTGQLVPGANFVPLNRGIDVPIRYSFFNGTQQFFNIQQQLASLNLKLEANQLPNENLQLFEKNFTTSLVSQAKSNFIWDVGDWSVEVTGYIDDDKYSSVKRFSVTDNDREKMLNITKHYASGIGILPNWRHYTSADYSPLITKRLNQ